MALHPQVKAFLDGLAEQNKPGWEELPPTESREIFSSLTDLFGDRPEVANVENRIIRENLSVRIYSPSVRSSGGDGLLPAIVFFHGGGWVLGDLDTHDALCRRLSNEAESVVIAVDYRPSPETVFPGALDDCVAATQFVAKEAAKLRVDPSRIIVVGDSAGGNLAAAVALQSRENGPKLCMQVLIYPALDANCESASYVEFAEGFGLSRKSMLWFWEQYRGASPQGSEELMSPTLASSLDGLPPTHIITAQYDVLRDEGEQYAQRLKESGVPTTHRRYDGVIHGFVHFCGLFQMGRAAISDIAKVIRDTATSR